jgi:NADH-quinone oxidoreductase subunit C
MAGMNNSLQTLIENLQNYCTDLLSRCRLISDKVNQVTIEVDPANLIQLMTLLRDKPEFAFEQLMDVCGVDYLAYGKTEWATDNTTLTGFSRGVEPTTSGRGAAIVKRLSETTDRSRRFAAVYQLQSVSHNQRLRVRAYASDDDLPVIPSVVTIWSSAEWYEREAFDLFGIVFEGHPDLRRLLTDYGFVGHPFRKDFPLIGNVEMRYDPDKGRVIYEPVTIEPRVLVPRVVRKDHRYVKPEVAKTNNA